MNLIHNAHYHKHWSSLNFGGDSYTILELCPFTYVKNCWLFSFQLSNFSSLNQMLWNLYSVNTFNNKTKINLEFWWSNFYCSRVVPRYKWNQMLRWAHLYTTTEVETLNSWGKYGHNIQAWHSSEFGLRSIFWHNI